MLSLTCSVQLCFTRLTLCLHYISPRRTSQAIAKCFKQEVHIFPIVSQGRPCRREL